MTISIGAPHVITPLGHDLATTLEAMREGRCAIAPTPVAPDLGGSLPAAAIPQGPWDGPSRTVDLAARAITRIWDQVDRGARGSGRWRWVLATTKGDIHELEHGDPEAAWLPAFGERVARKAGLDHDPIIISNACISGTLAIKHAADLVALDVCDHVLVVGIDVLSDFVLSGFTALHALSARPCRPFDNDRDGISLGEAAAALIVTRDPNIFTHGPLATYLGGGMGNDANHISGPSRTGEGLYRAVQAAFRSAAIGPGDVDHVNAHGTGSVYNDNMEAIAFGRCGVAQVGLNSYKGYFGHTLGAAGTVETAIALQGLREGVLLASLGATDTSAYPDLRVMHRSEPTQGRTLLKTSSGFGGCNAAIILRT
ncbi:MAG: beta-ketoacyl synthase [Flavobacteriales bacterium]|nr:beta-ketoacyl synthase [Flavobacteriales bacterium]MCB9167607.1 beta-ketoacyl synthase [Flavobacteriales bacterium]